MRPPRDEAGFTLVEVMMALAVFSLSIVGLTKAGTLSASSATTLELKSLAGIVADNALADLRAEPLRLGTRDFKATQLDREFTAACESARTEVAGLIRLRCDVRQDETDRVLISREAYRVAEGGTP